MVYILAALAKKLLIFAHTSTYTKAKQKITSLSLTIYAYLVKTVREILLGVYTPQDVVQWYFNYLNF